MPLYREIHDECDAEKAWITRYRLAGDLSAAEAGGAVSLPHLDVLKKHGLPYHKKALFAVNVAPGLNIDVYVYRESRAMMHVAVDVEEGVALVLTLRPFETPIDSSNADDAATTRLKNWWLRYGKLRKF